VKRFSKAERRATTNRIRKHLRTQRRRARRAKRSAPMFSFCEAVFAAERIVIPITADEFNPSTGAAVVGDEQIRIMKYFIPLGQDLFVVVRFGFGRRSKTLVYRGAALMPYDDARKFLEGR